MTIVSKVYDFKNKVAGSVVENTAVAMLNGVEFTQTQYDNIFGSALDIPATPLPVLEFEFPYLESKVVGVTIYFKSKTTGVITCERNDYGVFNRENVYNQKFLNVYDQLDDKGTLKFKITSTADISIYEVKIEVAYDDELMRQYSGYISTGDDTSNNRIFYNGLTKEQFIAKLESVSEDNISDFAGTWQPTAGEITP